MTNTLAPRPRLRETANRFPWMRLSVGPVKETLSSMVQLTPPPIVTADGMRFITDALAEVVRAARGGPR